MRVFDDKKNELQERPNEEEQIEIIDKVLTENDRRRQNERKKTGGWYHKASSRWAPRPKI